ncbi:MAG: hypothetical protein QOG52_935 [Frankiaceae bacterium]|nr:hypothetical protein [Frankiaceae bacterium]
MVTESSPPGDISDTAVYIVHSDPAAHYSVKVLEGWSQTTVGSAVRFTDKLNSITLSTQSAATAPTVASARAVTVPQLQQSEPAFTLKDVTALTRHAGPVVLVHYERDSPPNDVTGKVFREDVYRYMFFHAGTELDVVLSGPTGSDNVDPWRIVTDSVAWTK